MTRLPGINAELAAAVRRVNAEYARLPVEAQNSLDVTVDSCEAEIDKAILADDRERALVAIRAWKGYWLDRIERVAR